MLRYDLTSTCFEGDVPDMKKIPATSVTAASRRGPRPHPRLTAGKLGWARDRADRAVAGLVKTTVAAAGQLTFTLDRGKLRTVRQREGRHLLRPSLNADNPELLWRCYQQLVFVEEAFRPLKGDLALRPICRAD